MTNSGIKNLPFLCLLFILLLNMVSVRCVAQQKYEREYNVKASDVPKKAMEFISSVFKNEKVRWYGEESLTETTIEAKLKSKGKNYSIEFDKSGKLQDVEMLISFKEIDAKTRDIITKNLKDEFKSYKVSKTQRQWSGNVDDLKKAIVSDDIPKSMKTRFELVLKGRKTGITKYYEVLCESSGSIVSVNEIVQRNSDNLIY